MYCSVLCVDTPGIVLMPKKEGKNEAAVDGGSVTWGGVAFWLP